MDTTFETPDTSFAVDLGKDFGKAVIASAVTTAGMVIGMALVGAVINKTQARKAKKAAQTATPES